MKVILVSDVKNVGKKGDVVEVSEGYATNFLLKKGLAILQNKANLNDLNKQKEIDRANDAKAREIANETKNKLANTKVIFIEEAGHAGKLHNGITAKTIEEKLLNEYGIKVDKKNFKNFLPIKALGKVAIEVVLYKEIVGKISIEVMDKEN